MDTSPNVNTLCSSFAVSWWGNLHVPHPVHQILFVVFTPSPITHSPIFIIYLLKMESKKCHLMEDLTTMLPYLLIIVSFFHVNWPSNIYVVYEDDFPFTYGSPSHTFFFSLIKRTLSHQIDQLFLIQSQLLMIEEKISQLKETLVKFCHQKLIGS